MSLPTKKRIILTKEKCQVIINSLQEKLIDLTNLNDIIWFIVDFISKNTGYVDLVIYLYDDKQDTLIQRAAIGTKRNDNQMVINPIQIEPGEGIVGRAFISGLPRIIGDTSLDTNYIIDDRYRSSEISIPIFDKFDKDTTIGIIDSEHTSENFYTAFDQFLLTEVAEIISKKIPID